MATSTSTPAATNETTSPPGGVEVQQDARDKKRLYVSWAVTDQSLIAVARAARPEAKVVEARALSGPARAFGFVTFATEEEAAAALAAMNGKTITTEPIQVDFAKISSGEKKVRGTVRRNQNSARPKKKREPKAASGGNAPAGKKEPKPKKEAPAKQAAPQAQGENGTPAKRAPKKEKKEKAKKEDAPAATTTPASTSTPAATTTPSSPAPAKTTPAPAKSPATTTTPAATSTSSPAPKAEKAKGSKGKKEAPKA